MYMYIKHIPIKECDFKNSHTPSHAGRYVCRLVLYVHKYDVDMEPFSFFLKKNNNICIFIRMQTHFLSFSYNLLCGLGHTLSIIAFCPLPPPPSFPSHLLSLLCCSPPADANLPFSFNSSFSFSFSLFSLNISSSAFHLASASGILWRLRASSGVKIVIWFFFFFSAGL